jgi:hypothetical protein
LNIETANIMTFRLVFRRTWFLWALKAWVIYNRKMLLWPSVKMELFIICVVHVFMYICLTTKR